MSQQSEPTTTPKDQAMVSSSVKSASHKKLLLIGAGIIVVIVAIITALVLLGGPTKQDYKQGVDLLKTVRDDYQALQKASGRASFSSALSSGSGEAPSIDKEVAAYKESTGKLKDMKALRDKEVKEAYEAFAKKNEDFVRYLGDIGASYNDIFSMSKVCSEMGSVRSSLINGPSEAATDFRDKVAACKKSVDKLKQSKNTLLAEFGQAMAKSLGEIEEVMADLPKAIDEKDRATLSSLRMKMSQSVRSSVDTYRDFGKKMREEAKQYEVADDLNKLGQMMTRKYNEAK